MVLSPTETRPMSTPATDNKDPDRPDYVKSALTVAGSVGSVLTFIAAQPSDNVLKVGTFVVPAALVAVGCFLWYWKTDSTTKDLSGNPYRIRKFPKWAARTCWVSAGITALMFAVVWIWFHDTVLPVVTIDKYEGTEIPIVAQSKLRMSQTYGGIYKEGEPPPLYSRFTAYPAIVATLTRQGTGKVQIESVRLQVEEPNFGNIATETAAHYTVPVVLPNQYLVKIAKGQPEAEAQLHLDGNPSTALPVMDDKDPIARIHVGMEGSPGMYRVKLVVTVRDERGRKQTVTSGDGVIVNTSLKREPVEKEDLDSLDQTIAMVREKRQKEQNPEEQARLGRRLEALERLRRAQEKEWKEFNPPKS